MYHRGHLVFTSTVGNDHLIKSHYENTFLLSNGQSLQTEIFEDLFFGLIFISGKPNPDSPFLSARPHLLLPLRQFRAHGSQQRAGTLQIALLPSDSSAARLGSLEQVTEPL